MQVLIYFLGVSFGILFGFNLAHLLIEMEQTDE